MRYLKTLAASCAALFSLATANASAATIDFETLADGVTAPMVLLGGSVGDHTPFLVGSAYTTLGVTFSSEGDTDPETGPIFGNLSGFAGANTIIQDYKRATGASFNIRADFSGVVENVSVDVYAAAGNSVTMTAYDSGGLVLGAITSLAIATIGDSENIGLSGLGPIAYIIWEASSPFSSSVGIDNLTFDSSAVPLPAALPLFLAGLAGMGAASKRKKAKKLAA
ncbi:MAG: VPLPA-CTERM sorting domain-containing protein [Parvularculaceae bacterium]